MRRKSKNIYPPEGKQRKKHLKNKYYDSKIELPMQSVGSLCY